MGAMTYHQLVITPDESARGMASIPKGLAIQRGETIMLMGQVTPQSRREGLPRCITPKLVLPRPKRPPHTHCVETEGPLLAGEERGGG